MKTVTTVSEAEVLLAEAVRARREHEATQSQARVKLSAKAWRRGILALSGHGEDVVDRLREALAKDPRDQNGRSINYRHVEEYAHAMAERIRQNGWWEPGLGPAPLVAGVDYDRADTQIRNIPGANLYTAILLELEDLERRAPQAFGPLDDPKKYGEERRKVEDRAREALARFTEVPDEVLVSLAWRRGVEFPVDREPVDEVRRRDFAGVASRLVDDAMRGAEPSAAPHWEKGRRDTAAPAIGEAILGGTRFGA